MIEVKYNPEMNGKTKVTLEFPANNDRAFGAIFNGALIGIGAICDGTIETPNPTHIRRIYAYSAENVRLDYDSLVKVGCIEVKED